MRRTSGNSEYSNERKEELVEFRVSFALFPVTVFRYFFVLWRKFPPTFYPFSENSNCLSDDVTKFLKRLDISNERLPELNYSQYIKIKKMKYSYWLMTISSSVENKIIANTYRMKRDIVAFALIQFKDQLNLKNFNYSRSETEKVPSNKSKQERCKYEWKLHNPPHSRTIFFSKLLKIDIAAKITFHGMKLKQSSPFGILNMLHYIKLFNSIYSTNWKGIGTKVLEKASSTTLRFRMICSYIWISTSTNSLMKENESSVLM